MSLLDWILFLFLMFLGSWKAKELINTYVPKFVGWVVRKLEDTK